ncbi:IS21-like element helper ATPase IstB [Kangiella sp.]|uniref:IS21-like element helper ATPase IstB n=1 Tax=Kangiella sp. TaxID=1920245 RepID=UPI0019BC6558|nr:IS21-like element helper ATPase IstB [Kangiella sp.]MBD3654294.1 ATP-binding protein [Kangiella sp.]
MSYEQNVEQLSTLSLHGMAELYELHQDDTSIQSLSFDERLGLLIDSETHYREQRRQIRFTKAAKLKDPQACLENIDYTRKRGIEKSRIKELSACRWITQHQHIFLEGSTGTGKTFIANALASQAIRLGHKVIYKRLSRLLEETEIARADGTLPNLRLKLSKFKVIILDDWGVNPITARGRQDLLELVEDKTGTGSIVVTSQLPVKKWHEWLGDETIADAILDRIVHRAHILKLKGESMRKVKGLEES